MEHWMTLLTACVVVSHTVIVTPVHGLPGCWYIGYVSIRPQDVSVVDCCSIREALAISTRQFRPILTGAKQRIMLTNVLLMKHRNLTLPRNTLTNFDRLRTAYGMSCRARPSDRTSSTILEHRGASERQDVRMAWIPYCRTCLDPD